MRKIDQVNYLRGLGLRTLEVSEFKHSQVADMLNHAQKVKERFGGFNLRTDLAGGDSANFELPFVKNCDISTLLSIVGEYKDKLTYLIQQPVDDSKLLFNGVLRLCDNHLIGEVNDKDKTSLREAMRNFRNLKIINEGSDSSNPLFTRIINDLSSRNIDHSWVEVSAFNNGEIVYWQLRPEKMNNFLKSRFFKP